MNQFEVKLRDHLNGHIDKDYERIEKGEDLSKEAPMKMKAYNDYKNKGENMSEGFSTKRMDE